MYLALGAYLTYASYQTNHMFRLQMEAIQEFNAVARGLIIFKTFTIIPLDFFFEFLISFFIPEDGDDDDDGDLEAVKQEK